MFVHSLPRMLRRFPGTNSMVAGVVVGNSYLPYGPMVHSTSLYSTKHSGDKSPNFTEKDVDANKLDHPYWDSVDFDDTFFMDELFGEFESEYDFELPSEDTPYLENEWHSEKPKK